MAIESLPYGGITAETLAMAKQALIGLSGGVREAMEKGAMFKAGVSLAENLVGINLEAPAKKLYPVYSPLRKRIPRIKAPTGAKEVTWRSVKSINKNKVWAEVAEAARNVFETFDTETLTATMKTLDFQGFVTVEAIAAGRAFEDVLAFATLATLQNLMIREDLMLLGGNVTNVGAPGAPAGAEVAGGVAFGDATYKFKVSALVLKGHEQGAQGIVGGVDAAGESTPSVASADIVVGAGGHVELTWADKKAAVAYNVYAKKAADPTFTFQKTVTVNKWVSDAAYDNTGNVPNAADQTGSALQFDGVIPFIENNVTGNAYVTKDAGTLTSDGAAGIKEFDKVLRAMWDNFRLGATVILMNAEQFADVTSKIAGSSPLSMRIMLQDGDRSITGGVAVTTYLNKFGSSFAEGFPQSIPMVIHPFLPPGTILFLTEQLPYPNNQVPNTLEVEVNQELTQRNYAFSTRRFEFGIDEIMVLKSYFSAAHGVIKNVSPG